MSNKRYQNQSNRVDPRVGVEKNCRFAFRFRFSGIIDKNIEQLRLMNNSIFPITYSEHFYNQVQRWGPEYCKFAVFNDLTVGSICCKVIEKNVMYIMTLGVLTPYRRMGIGSRLLEKVDEIIKKHESRPKNPKIKKIQLHVHFENNVAIKFYERIGFKNVRLEKEYYEKKSLLVRDAYVLEKEVGAPPNAIEGVKNN